MNLFLVDVCEEFSRRKPASVHADQEMPGNTTGQLPQAAAALQKQRPDPGDRSLASPNAKSTDNYEVVKRFLSQVLIRGDNVVAVRLENP